MCVWCASVCIYIQIYKNEKLRQDFTDSPSFLHCLLSELSKFETQWFHKPQDGDCHCESSTLIVQVTMDLLAISGESTDAAKSTDVHGSSSNQLGQWER